MSVLKALVCGRSK